MGFLLYNYRGNWGTGKGRDEIIHILLLIRKNELEREAPRGASTGEIQGAGKRPMDSVQRKRVLGNPLLFAWLAAGAERESSIQGCMKRTPENKITGIITDIFMAAVAGVYGYHMQHYITGLQEFEFVTSRSTVIKCVIRRRMCVNLRMWVIYLDLCRWSSAARLAWLSSSWRCRWRRFRQGATSVMSFKLASIGLLSGISVRQNMEKFNFINSLYLYLHSWSFCLLKKMILTFKCLNVLNSISLCHIHEFYLILIRKGIIHCKCKYF